MEKRSQNSAHNQPWGKLRTESEAAVGPRPREHSRACGLYGRESGRGGLRSLLSTLPVPPWTPSISRDPGRRHGLCRRAAPSSSSSRKDGAVRDGMEGDHEAS